MKVILSTIFALVLAASAAHAADYGVCSEDISAKIAGGGAAMEIYHFDYNTTSGTLTLYDPEGMASVWQGSGSALGDRGTYGVVGVLGLPFMVEAMNAMLEGKFFYVAAKEGDGWKTYYAFETTTGVCAISFFPQGVLKEVQLPRGIQKILDSENPA